MTEEIIIDGIDVAECEYISDIDCSCIFVKNYYGTTTNPRCSQVKNCHYKQLKRLEQVNKEVIEDNLNLSKENKELKEEIQLHNKENSNLLAERNAAQIGYDEIREVRELYRSALKKISGLASPHCTQCSQIIKIINEVLK